VAIYQVATLEDLVAKSVAPRRFIMILLEIFGGLALLLTAIGVYGVISYSVTERTREIGIRAALGATPRNIVRLILGSGLTTVNAGLAVGLVAALGATRYLESSLFEVHAHDPATFVTIALVLFAVAVGAQIVPIARALRVEPNVALRQE
jgi:putative ABC transport system permease protein